jgi:hypothetical protein
VGEFGFGWCPVANCLERSSESPEFRKTRGITGLPGQILNFQEVQRDSKRWTQFRKFIFQN